MSAASGGAASSTSGTGVTFEIPETAAVVARVFRALEEHYDASANTLSQANDDLARLRGTLGEVLSNQGAVRSMRKENVSRFKSPNNCHFDLFLLWAR